MQIVDEIVSYSFLSYSTDFTTRRRVREKRREKGLCANSRPPFPTGRPSATPREVSSVKWRPASRDGGNADLKRKQNKVILRRYSFAVGGGKIAARFVSFRIKKKRKRRCEEKKGLVGLYEVRKKERKKKCDVSLRKNNTTERENFIRNARKVFH